MLQSEMHLSPADPELAATLYRLGLTPKYCGYHSILAAMELIQENPERLSAIVKDVYMDVARMQGRPWRSVERNIRYAATSAWKTNPAYLQQLLRCPLQKAPSNGDFLLMLYFSTLNNES